MVYSRIKRNLPKLMKFGCVGALGAVVNFSAYFIAVEYAHAPVNVAAILAFCVAVTHNYLINHSWTFRAENQQNPVNARQYTYYFIGNLIGLAIKEVFARYFPRPNKDRPSADRRRRQPLARSTRPSSAR